MQCTLGFDSQPGPVEFVFVIDVQTFETLGETDVLIVILVLVLGLIPGVFGLRGG